MSDDHNDENQILRQLVEMQQFKDLAQDGQIRQLRDLERKNKQLQHQLEDANLKREQAEQEVQASEYRFRVLTDDLPELAKHQYDLRQIRPGGEATALAVLSDWHAEEQVDSDTINGSNAFDLAEAERRIKRSFEKIAYLLNFSRTLAQIDDLVLAVIGDLITGYIHEEFESNNFLSPTEAVLFTQEHLVGGIEFLLKETDVKHILVPTCFGNHGRITKFKRISNRWRNSYEWMSYHQASRYFKDEPRVTWKIEKGYHNWVDIQGWHIRLHHGDDINYGGGVGGITIPVMKAIAQWDKIKPAHLDVFGHFHQFMDHWKYVSNGCLIGYNAYALSIKADFQPPTQSFIVIDKDYGKTLAMPIFCTPRGG